MHWRGRSRSGDYNAIVNRGNNRTSHQGQLISKLEDTKGLTRKSKNDKQYNSQMKRDKRTNSDLQNNTLKTKDRATRTPLKTGVDLRCFGRGSSSCSTCGTRRVTIFTNSCPSRSAARHVALICVISHFPYPITLPKARVRKQPSIRISFYMTSSCLPVICFI